MAGAVAALPLNPDVVVFNKPGAVDSDDMRIHYADAGRLTRARAPARHRKTEHE